MWPPERLDLELRLYRLSSTRQRTEVFQVMKWRGPLRRAQIVRALAGSVDGRTVYRTIKAFINARIAHELPGGLIELSPPFRQLHYHISCTGCGRHASFWDEALEKKLNRILELRKYVMPAHQVELSGLCSLCAQQI